MKHLKKFKTFESVKEVSILDKDIENHFPKSLTIITDNGEFKFQKSSITREIDILRVLYTQNKWGESDTLQIDLHFVKKQNNTKILVDVTYGDFMASEFSIFKNKVSIIHYNGKGSKLDKSTHFGFKNESLQELINLFNKFGFKLKLNQFTFIDEELDSYTPNNQFDVAKIKSNQ